MALHIKMEIRKNRLFVRLKGELDQAVTEKLKVRISELIDKYEIKYLIFNFEKVNFMDSSGIGFIIGRYTQIKKHNGKVYVLSLIHILNRIKPIITEAVEMQSLRLSFELAINESESISLAIFR